MSSSVSDFVRRQVPDWDDEIAATARFKAFSGQRSDWEAKYLFWRDLILQVARHLGTFIIQPSEVKTSWFMQRGLTPLCIDHVLVEMYNAGDILPSGDLMDPTSGRLYQMFKRVVHLVGISRSSAPQVILEDRLILKTLLQERAAEVIKLLSESHWTSSCVITMGRFQSICNGSNEASAILNYLSRCGKAQYLSMGKKDFIQGVKISLVAAAVPGVSSLDCDALHLIWTMERLQQQLDVIDQRCEKSKKSALASSKSGNKQAALDHIRQLKLTSGSREKCVSLLNRVEEVLNAIYIAESTKKVSEAIKIGARTIKENGISIEEVELVLQEVDESVAAQKQVEEALESVPAQSTGFEDDVEEEFKKLEMELGDEHPQILIIETVAGATASGAAKETKIQESAESLSQTLSNLKLETA